MSIVTELFGLGWPLGYGRSCPTCGRMLDNHCPCHGQLQPMQPPGGSAQDVRDLLQAIAQQQDAHRKAWRRMEERERYRELVRRSAYRKGWVERLKEVFR